MKCRQLKRKELKQVIELQKMNEVLKAYCEKYKTKETAYLLWVKHHYFCRCIHTVETGKYEEACAFFKEICKKEKAINLAWEEKQKNKKRG